MGTRLLEPPLQATAIPNPWASAPLHPSASSTDTTLEKADQEVTSILERLLGSKAPGPSTGDLTGSGPCPGMAPALQEAGSQPPVTGTSEAPGEAQTDPNRKDSQGLTPP
ncbi:hypothetical protein P7K49_035301 [Saguinus oedipus]|uniref:Uncharacterized protein n=1 Tax=Saguinus oedipus TaxID=9490 RepID=A0ABQ9TM78_SAGOE|nr:hypothetical protein P7K49_035301 [Saguinus oedipus]